MRAPSASSSSIRNILLLGLGLLASGCIDEPGDEREDAFLTGGKADTGGITDGTPEAAAILHVANTMTRTELVAEVGLAGNAARNIVAVRVGDDEVAGTEDDASFASLAALDAVPFVGPAAFAKLLQYVQDADLVGTIPVAVSDPFDPAACVGPDLSQAQARARITAGEHILGSYQLAIRERWCENQVCSTWQPVALSRLPWAQDASGILMLASSSGEVRLAAQARRCGTTSSNQELIVGSVCDGVGHDLQCSGYGEPAACRTPGAAEMVAPNGQYFQFSGKVTERCAHLTSSTWNFQRGLTVYEVEAAILVRF